MSKKINIKEFYEINSHYKELQQKANDFYKELKELNNQLDLEEVKNNCSYEEIKDIYDTMKYCTSNKSILEEIVGIMNEKSVENIQNGLSI